MFAGAFLVGGSIFNPLFWAQLSKLTGPGPHRSSNVRWLCAHVSGGGGGGASTSGGAGMSKRRMSASIAGEETTPLEVTLLTDAGESLGM